MARIRIIDEWLRSPVSTPTRHRAVMVVADTWSEQRVLMRAFSSCTDQTRPTIHLHGSELAIGPAGTEPHGKWGIHVEPPVDGRAQELRGALELAARRLAGSKGNPPRLVDEVPDFDKKPTNLWRPGAPRDASSQPTVFGRPQAGYYEPVEAARSAASATRARQAQLRRTPPFWTEAGPASSAAAGGAPDAPPTSEMRPARPAAAEVGATTTAGFEGPGVRPRPVRTGPNLARLVAHTMPLGFSLSDEERAVLNALGASRSLGLAEISQLVNTSNAMEWMERFMSKLADHGLDLVVPGDDCAGEPTYVLRR